jgi:hypothetical protein
MIRVISKVVLAMGIALIGLYQFSFMIHWLQLNPDTWHGLGDFIISLTTVVGCFMLGGKIIADEF